MAAVYLQRKRKKRLEQGQPWIFQNEVDRVEGEPQGGSLVSVLSHIGQFLAVGYYNPKSQIVVRVVAYKPLEVMSKSFFVERFQQCLAFRARFIQQGDAYRLVYGEADFLPGLIVDKFADVLVVQILTLGMDCCRQQIVDALVEVIKPTGIYERSDVSIRELEGLEQVKGNLYGVCPPLITINENGMQIEVDIYEGQKTGYFFDQRENRTAIAPLMAGWGKRSGIELKDIEIDGQLQRMPVNANNKAVTFPYWDGASVLECFSHTGSFTLNACLNGAKKVTCLDISERAIESAKRNIKLNGFEDRVEFIVADAFEYLREQVRGLELRKSRATAAEKKQDTSKPLEAQGRTWDVVILDPPAFAKTRSAVEGACRGYKDINLHGMKPVS
jgi:23S rRNA (cytosine1962-C5)-methyltransferase